MEDALHLEEMGVKSRKRKTSTMSDEKEKSEKSGQLRKCSAPKKFSHSSRRRTRRQVDRILLETPEEDLELTNMPMKDLIMFYLHKEKMEDKETKSKKTSTNSSNQNDASHNEEEIFGTERNSGFADNQGGDAVQMTNPYFNYQSYMDKTQRVKWSKQDDELFYKSIQQFGIDLSMIQLRFPDRTRRQIKLKLKEEERQHPMMLTEAVQTRAEDLSQFELIIDQFKKTRAEQEFDGSESISMAGEEGMDDITTENNDEASEHGEEEDAEEEETTRLESPSQFNEIDDDFDISDYKSEY